MSMADNLCMFSLNCEMGFWMQDDSSECHTLNCVASYLSLLLKYSGAESGDPPPMKSSYKQEMKSLFIALLQTQLVCGEIKW